MAKSKTKPFFSVITPVHLWNADRVEKFVKCADSLRNQTFKDFEWIVVDDGSTEPFLWESIQDIADTIIHTDHFERVNAYREAFKEAKGEWFALLDSDDEFDEDYLKFFSLHIELYPDYKMFNCGAKYVHQDGKVTNRGSFKPALNGDGHEMFGPGNIVNGTFIWNRELYDKLGGFPDKFVEDVDCTELNYKDNEGNYVRRLAMSSPYDFSAFAQLEFPEIKEYFFIDRENEPDKAIRELGNPWGQDFYLFYKYTRHHQSLPFDIPLYIVHPR